ncbi:hypothetical protein [Lacticaseibacillus paracasei]|uniref:Uncharacterized protein n=1 Tax=Lacticaseibacillus paracasei (strain ATCC 334 / BCRC 17002 / CCUG 31169 / CIP 107868 / KCTC 3260 / NRRL B-441) TaxID=321967 RepID=Q036Y8_LACP3|nr:hypothetical protein [Lacticaseibacillus paracasei]ABD83426.1 hypothetical protein Lcas072 [Lacticaseibacillus paracasei ATCC 334]ABJ70734.1 hypothetical protein LSEI_1976 [Lacticaseibacillus paracasei ATCC 334]OSY81105.1 hypothetical protein BLW95_03480 [Lacticaseibacillus paracasei]
MVKHLTLAQFQNLPSFAADQYVLGYAAMIIERFKHNPDIRPFLENTFELTYKDYVFKSKTLVISRVLRDLNKSLGNQTLSAEQVYSSLNNFTSNKKSKDLLSEKQEYAIPRTSAKKKSNSNDKLSKWLQGL